MVNYTPARNGMVFYNTSFTKLGNRICLIDINIHIPSSVAEKPQSGIYYILCTLLGCKPQHNVAIEAIGILNDSKTILPVLVWINTDGNVSLAAYGDTVPRITYLYCNGAFLL